MAELTNCILVGDKTAISLGLYTYITTVILKVSNHIV